MSENSPTPSADDGTIVPSPEDAARMRAAASVAAVGVPGFEIEGTLGRGGMGVVYKATQTGLNRVVALKMLIAGQYADPSSRARFLLEAESVAALEHPHIIRVLAFGESGGHPYLAMGYVPGSTLADRVKANGPLPANAATELVAKLANAVAHAHSRGVVHRDIKPANVLLTADGEPRLADFGLAKVGRSDLSVTGQVLGTPAYMAPEQARGEKMDARTDLWSLGVMLYRMATGKQPFAGTSAMAVLIAVTTDTPRPVRELAPYLPPALVRLIEQLMCKEVAGRLRSAAEVTDALRRIEAEQAQALDLPAETDNELTEEELEAAPEPRARRTKRTGHRGLMIGAAILFAVLAIVGAGAFALNRWGRVDKGTGVEQAATPIPQPPATDPNANRKPAPDDTPAPPKTNPPKTDTPLPKPQPAGPVEVNEPGKKPGTAVVPTVWPPKERVTVLGDERFRHWGQVNAIAASPDGKWVVTITASVSASNGYARYVLPLWDVAKGKEIATAEDEHYGIVVAFAPDSRRLAVMAGGLSIILWDCTGGVLKKGETLKAFGPAGERPRPGSTEHFTRVSFALGGKALVACGLLGTVWEWTLNAEDGTATPDTVTAPPVVYPKMFAVSADGKTMAWAQELATTRKTRLWVRRLGEPNATELGDSVEPVSSLALSNDARSLAAVVGDVTHVWDLGGALPRVRVSLTLPKVPAATGFHVWGFSPDGRFLACGNSTDGSVWCADLRDEKPALAVVTGAVVLDLTRNGTALV